MHRTGAPALQAAEGDHLLRGVDFFEVGPTHDGPLPYNGDRSIHRDADRPVALAARTAVMHAAGVDDGAST